MLAKLMPDYGFQDLYITAELDRRAGSVADYRQEMLAIHDLAVRMADSPDNMLPRFVDLAMEITGGISAGISLYEPDPAPGLFRWRYLRGMLQPFDGATTPRNFSPCGVTLDRDGPVLSLHPERAYDWIADAGIVVPEVLLVPVYLRGARPLGTLWIVSETEGHFTRDHARAMTELSSFVAIALRMRETERELQAALEQQEILAKEMSHRLKNVFTIADGIVRMSARGAADKDAFAASVSGRLHALASAHSLVSRNLRELGDTPSTGDVATLLRAVIAPHDHPRGEAPSCFSLSGPAIDCGSQAMNGIALIFHELATNAAKYGALSTITGQVDIRWQIDGDDLVMTWGEQGGPVVARAPDRRGFGGTLVRNTVAGQFGGKLDYDWAPAGVTVTIRAPLARLVD